MLDGIYEVQVGRSPLCKGKMGTNGLRAPCTYCDTLIKELTHRLGPVRDTEARLVPS